MNVTALEGVVPAVFSSREDAEAGMAALREAGFSNDDLGVMIPDPEHLRLIDDSSKEAWKGLSTGMIAGIPIGTLAGMALTALIIPGLGILGVGGALLVGGVGGALWGTYIGSTSGLAAEISHVEDIERRYEIPLRPNEILLIVVANDRAVQVCEIMERHGAHCFWEQPAI